MIKLQDFATAQHVTDRQIQRLLKKYEKELEGLFQRKGPNGTWLTDEACEILRSKMRQAPATVLEEDPRLAKLEAENADLQRRLNSANEAFQIYVANTSATLMKAKEQLQLAEQSEVNRKKAEELENEKKALELKKQEAENAKAEAELALEDARERISEFEAYEALPWYKKPFVKNPIRKRETNNE